MGVGRVLGVGFEVLDNVRLKSDHFGLLLLTLPKFIYMKTILLLLGLSLTIYGCGSGNTGIKKSTETAATESDIVRIANDSLEYEIIIIESGFDSWLISQPPRGHYGQSYLETKNRLFVSDYNNRVMQPARYSSNLYSERINYDPAVDYGYEVNYMLYNYFMYFQDKYKQRLTGGRN